jgi:hypothetical protein
VTPRKKVRALAEEMRDRLAEGGPRFAAELCREIERRYGSHGLDAVLDEFMVLHNAERDALEGAKFRVH